MRMNLRTTGLATAVTLAVAMTLTGMNAALAAPSPVVKVKVEKDAKGRIVPSAWPVEAKFLNPWTPELEEGFKTRADEMIRKYAGKSSGNTYGENEKAAYPSTMMDLLNGNVDKAVKTLEARDAENGADAACGGIDYYWCFTVKQQVRKYFYFGSYLTPAYRTVMYDQAKVWTDTDPATRPHPNPDATQNASWGAKKTRVCVDRRNTDNLQAMRIAGVYLLAEETGNEKTRLIYKDHIAKAVRNMFRLGIGEWDSENYLGHTMTGYIQLFDFAKDPEVKLMGKAAMDYLCASGAVKYFKGGFGGPVKRDYNNFHVWGGSAADHLGLYFGDCPIPNDEAAGDNVHFVTSAYRPPMAVVALARKQFNKPVELLNTNADYGALRGDGTGEPAYYETMYYGNTFQFGTLSSGTGDGDTNGFKLLAENSKRGVDYFIANTVTNPHYMGSPKYSDEAAGFVGGNNVAHYRNLAIWLNGKADAPFLFFLPKSAKVEQAGGVWFIAMEKTWVALHGINLKINGIDAAKTEEVNYRVSKDKKTGAETKTPDLVDDQVMSAVGTAAPVVGFAMEIGEAQTHGDFAAFKKAVLASGKLDLSKVKSATVTYTGSKGGSVGLTWDGTKKPTVWRNGEEHNWARHTGKYVPADGSGAPIRMDWQSGKLRVEAGGQVFEGQVSDKGVYTFSNAKGK